MGTGYKPKKKSFAKNKQYKRSKKLGRREKDTDQLQDEIAKASETNGDSLKFEFDDELPGGGQFYCPETGKHFINARALADHKKSRHYKRRCKELKEEKYDQSKAEWAAGMTKEDLPPAHGKK